MLVTHRSGRSCDSLTGGLQSRMLLLAPHSIRLLLVAGLLAVAASTFAQPSFKTPVSYADADKRAAAILAKMTVEEKLQLVTGHNSFYIKGFPQHGIPELYLSDATQGVNIRRNLSDQLEKSVSFPAGIGLAACWNPKLAYDYAHSVGEECRAGGIAVLLGPGMNIYRSSQSGRNFEYFGEDPHLAARIISQYVTGVLDTGTIPTLKHFVANETEFHRRTSNSIVDERTLHEIYLPAFKAGIDAGAMAVMTSYNQLNGEYCGQSEKVITDLLRKQLGFKWLVMTDWWSVWDAEKIIKSGQDLEMPGDKYIKADGLRLLKAGKVSEADIDRMAREIIRTTIAMGLYDRPVKDPFFLGRFGEHEKVALQAGREAVVLLKNSDGVLPLRKGGSESILLTGRFAEELARGGGAADVEGYDVATLLSALKATYGDKLQYVKKPTDEQIKAAGAVLLSTGTKDSEGWDRPFALPNDEEKEVTRVVGLNPRTIVIVNSGGGIQMTGWNDKAAAIVYAWYPGQSGNRALAEILCGDVNPSGKLPITIEKSFEDSPAYGYLPAGTKLYSGWGPDNDMSQPILDVQYKEGVFVGYRWYESKKIEPLYAFGHGLSYTTFAYKDLRLSTKELSQEDRLTVEFTVTNTGKVGGAETAQLYVGAVAPSLPRPIKELKGFSKVVLQPGESRVVRLRLAFADFAYWDTGTHGWRTDPGEYRLSVGGASNQIALDGTVALK
jgi:beta-glucosidase